MKTSYIAIVSNGYMSSRKSLNYSAIKSFYPCAIKVDRNNVGYHYSGIYYGYSFTIKNFYIGNRTFYLSDK